MEWALLTQTGFVVPVVILVVELVVENQLMVAAQSQNVMALHCHD